VGHKAVASWLTAGRCSNVLRMWKRWYAVLAAVIVVVVVVLLLLVLLVLLLLVVVKCCDLLFEKHYYPKNFKERYYLFLICVCLFAAYRLISATTRMTSQRRF
jgi:hypothetical protein